MSAATRRGERGRVARQEEIVEAESGAPDSVMVDGAGLLRSLRAGTDWLARNVAGINALNVFPVPDGDTGTNMFLTMQSASAAAAERGENETRSVGDVANRAAHGALMGARGNSGVILSQIFRGMAKALDGHLTLDGALLAAACTEASAMAYKAVMKPVEGTLLTVSRGAAEAAERAARDGGDVQAVLDGALAGARATLAQTPEMLPLLREAGVVDAGGQGYVVILEGMRLHLAGRNVAAEVLPTIALGETAMAFDVTGLHAQHGTDEYGYCTNYLLTAAPGTSLDVAIIRETMAAMGHSAVIVGDEQYIKAHIHATDPGALLSYAVRFGSLTQIKIDNMDVQVEHLERSAPLDTPREESTGHLAVVAVAAGEGLSAVLRGLGATTIVRGGQTMNPSTQELLDAIASAPSNMVIVLPNNGNVILTARQAAAMATKQVRVVPTTSIPQGIAALSAFTFTADLDTNAAAMTETARGVRTGEVTRAVRDATIGGVAVKVGEVIGLLDDLLTVAGDDSVTVALDLLGKMDAEHAELVTLYTGADVSDTIAEALGARIAACYPDVAVEIVTGGQPHYDFIVSVE
ncbi:MAG: DAK2 domain-containing protein [Thermomicrobiales bacterium]